MTWSFMKRKMLRSERIFGAYAGEIHMAAGMRRHYLKQSIEYVENR